MAQILLTGGSECPKEPRSGWRQPLHSLAYKDGAGHHFVLFLLGRRANVGEGTAAGSSSGGRGCRTKKSGSPVTLQFLTPSRPGCSGDWPGGGRQPLLHAGFGGGVEEKQASFSCAGMLGISQVQGSSGGGARWRAESQDLALDSKKMNFSWFL